MKDFRTSLPPLVHSAGLFLVGVLLRSGVAQGQELGGLEIEGPGEEPTEVDVAEPPRSGGTLGEAHSVQTGDTLWDLCAKYLNSPWYWPKIWSYNPQLTNPHWIFPGNEVRFYPGDEALPTEIDVARAITVDDDDLVIPGVLTEEDLVQTVGTIEVGRAPANSVLTSFLGYLSKGEVERSGRLAYSSAESIMLSDFDRVYVKSPSTLAKGTPLAIYRMRREVIHPITGESYGYSVEIVGGLEIVATGEKVATARLSQVFRPVLRDDLVGPWPENFGVRVAPTPNTKNAKGYVLETAGDVLGPIGEHNMVYIDRGRKHGVQIGNTFVVYHRGDGLTGETRDLPNEPVAQLMVIDAKDEAATAVVMNSLLEINVGDKIEMIPGASAF